jgi:hypothetical protein
MIRGLAACLVLLCAAPAGAQVAEPSDDDAAAVPEAAPPDDGSGLRVAGAILIGTAFASLAATTYYVQRGKDLSDEAEALSEAGVDSETIRRDFDARGEKANRLALAWGGLTAALTVVGGLTYWAGARRGAAAAAVSLQPGGATISYAWSF